MLSSETNTIKPTLTQGLDEAVINAKRRRPVLLGLTVPTPLDDFLIIAAGETVLASGWADDFAKLTAVLPPNLRESELEISDATHPGVSAVKAYFNGDFAALSRVSVATPERTEFQRSGYQALCGVEPGVTVSYRELAALSGSPKAVRAAASLCAKNPVTLFVPCHRVVPSSGGSGKYAWGPERKATLLELESAQSSSR